MTQASRQFRWKCCCRQYHKFSKAFTEMLIVACPTPECRLEASESFEVVTLSTMTLSFHLHPSLYLE